MGSLEQPIEYVHYHAGGIPGRRPVLTGAAAKPTFDKLPMIDMTPMFSQSLDERKALANEIGKACREVGFFFALNHDIPDEVINETFAAIAKYFALPKEVKMQNHIHKNASFRGYEPLFETKLDPSSRGDMKEAFLMGEDSTDVEQGVVSSSTEPKNNWPTHPDAMFFRPALYKYYAKILAFSRRLLQIFALALDLEENAFDNIATFPMANIRALHYPPQETSTGQDVGIGAHTDYCWFTLVCQDDVPALEVLNDNGMWVPAPPTPQSFVVNVGDFLSQTTGGVWQSTVHRVRNMTGQERYSMPFFFSPNADAKISVLEKFREPGKDYEEVGVADYFAKRLRAARYRHPKVMEGVETAV